jgi:large subunit ribosomal protein L19
LTTEKMAESKASNPAVWETKFRVGDAIEIQLVSQGGVKSTNPKDFEKVRGVVLGIFKKGLDYSVLIRDVVFGEPLERRISLHSTTTKSVKLLEENFVFKGRRKIKRAKLYYLSDRNPLGKFLSESIVCIPCGLISNAVLLLRIPRDPRYQVVKINSSVIALAFGLRCPQICLYILVLVASLYRIRFYGIDWRLFCLLRSDWRLVLQHRNIQCRGHGISAGWLGIAGSHVRLDHNRVLIKREL